MVCLDMFSRIHRAILFQLPFYHFYDEGNHTWQWWQSKLSTSFAQTLLQCLERQLNFMTFYVNANVTVNRKAVRQT
jgi:hypothetical protein